MTKEIQRILVVDDSAEDRMAIKRVLGKMDKGYEIVEAESGEEGLTKVEQESFDLIICELEILSDIEVYISHMSLSFFLV